MKEFLPVILLLGTACTLTREPLPLPGAFFAEQVVDEDDTPRSSAWIGLEVTLNENDDPASLELSPGVRVSALDAAGPAARAGLRLGDVLLSFDGIAVQDPGRLAHLLANVGAARAVALEVQRGSRLFVTELTPEIRTEESGKTLAWIERALLRVAVRDAAPHPGQPVRLGPEILGFGPESPLAAAGIVVGERILRFQGEDPGSAAAFVRSIGLRLRPGDDAELSILGTDGREREVRVQAWAPGTALTQLGLWPVFCWEDEINSDRGLFWIGDLLFVQLFRVDRLGRERRWSVLGLLHWRTGEAVLEEEPVIAVPLGGTP